MKKLLFISLLFIFVGCKSNAELSMERGIQYYEWEMIDEAILEFNTVIRELPENTHKLSNTELDLLTRAYHNISISYAKKGWFDMASQSAENAFWYKPTAENRKTLNAIKEKMK
jgi:hypothetical protein